METRASVFFHLDQESKCLRVCCRWETGRGLNDCEDCGLCMGTALYMGLELFIKFTGKVEGRLGMHSPLQVLPVQEAFHGEC